MRKKLLVFVILAVVVGIVTVISPYIYFKIISQPLDVAGNFIQPKDKLEQIKDTMEEIKKASESLISDLKRIENLTKAKDIARGTPEIVSLTEFESNISRLINIASSINNSIEKLEEKIDERILGYDTLVTNLIMLLLGSSLIALSLATYVSRKLRQAVGYIG